MMPRHKNARKFFLNNEMLESRDLLAVAPVRIAQSQTETVTYKTTTAGQPLKLTIIKPSSESVNASGVPIVFAIHGGGWVRFDRSNILTDLNYIPENGYALIAPDYTLATNQKPSWSDNLTDLQDAFDWVITNGAARGLDTTDVTLAGQSAGGHLAAMLAISESGQKDTMTGPLVDRLIDVSGPMDLPRLVGESPLAAGRAKTMLGQTFDTNPDLWKSASPSYLLESNPKIKMPATLIIQGTVDPVVPLDQSTEFQNQLVKLSVSSRLEKIAGAGHELLKGSIASKTKKLIVGFLKSGV